MTALTLILILLAVAASLHLVARRLDIPHPVLLVLGGLVLALLPGLPRAELNPDVVFLVFVPPLLYRAALITSWRDFRSNLRSISLLAVGLVVATIVVVAAAAQWLVPRLSWASAFVLGAIVAPPDPVAAIAVLRRLDTPRHIETILEGEGLVNDATALVAYRISVNAVSSGSFSWSDAAVRFSVAAAGGIAVGLLTGMAVAWLRKRVDHLVEVENTMSLLTPFAAFIAADRLGLSGVLAVAAVGLYLGREGPRIVSAETRVNAASMWDMTTFLLEGLIFILVGLDLPLVVRSLAGGSAAQLALYGLVISGVAIGVRMTWMFLGAYLLRHFDEWRGHDAPNPPWRHVFFVGWAGMRGADSLAVALALPLTASGGHPFPGRSVIISVTFVVILVTLVAQGLTLKPLIQWLGLRGERIEEEEESVARLRTARAGLARLDALLASRPDLAGPARELRKQQVNRVQQYRGRASDGTDEKAERYANAVHEAREEMIEAERRELVRLRDDGVIADGVMRRIQRDLDLEQLLVGGSDDTLDGIDEGSV